MSSSCPPKGQRFAEGPCPLVVTALRSGDFADFQPLLMLFELTEKCGCNVEMKIRHESVLDKLHDGDIVLEYENVQDTYDMFHEWWSILSPLRYCGLRSASF